MDALCAQLLVHEAITASSFLPCEILNFVDFDRGEGSAAPRCGKPLLEFLNFLMEGLLVRDGPMLYELAAERPLPAARLIDIAMQISPPAYAMLSEGANEHRRWVRSKRKWEWETGLVVRVDLPMLEQTSYEGVTDLSLHYA